MVRVEYGDIRNYTGDGVVNPSNTELFLGSGVSGVLKMMCPKLQEVMYEYIKTHGLLQPGEIAITPYPCREFEFVIHAAVMDYTSSNPNPDYERIEMILQNIKKFLDTKKLKIITPLLGTGVGGLDKKRVLDMMKEAFIDIQAEIVIVLRN
ncbi:MAG: hypothetical protein GXO62_04075 [Epsilonproteobacteria bacterium]|nr:hypothetical protein [Campylobacterota bacterium]